MTTEAQLEIPIDEQLVIFKEHLDDVQNERIIFSGIFGIGKSYFLDKFFEKKSDEYLAITLNPVNYSISNNEDIFRLIKYDILYELIVNHKLELETEIISRHIAYGTVLTTKAEPFLEGFLSIAPLLNKSLGDSDEMANPAPFVSFLKKIIPEVEKVEKDRKDANLNQRVLDYIKDLEHSSLFETDFITGFVIDSLERLANKEGQKKLKVLVIDDLDRIDPEHIFRLFNIFSSYQNYRKSAYNKFGFDKVVFVCDIENIRNVFSTRYGASVDFSGYIDKFYSTNVFYFDNSSAVTTFTDKIVSSLKFDENSTYAAAFLKSLEHADNALLRFFIKVGIDSGALSLRKIKSILTRTYSIKEHILPFYHKRGISNLNLPAVVSLEVMIHYFGGVIHLKRALQRMGNYKKSRHTNIMNHSQSGNDLNIIGYFIPVLDYEQHNFDLDQEDSSREPFEYDLKGQKIVYRLSNLSPLSNIYHGRISRESDTNYSFAVIDIIQVTLDHLVDVGYFKAD